jgi:chorismate mutase
VSTTHTEIRVPISPGELIDKITILEIKSERMTDAKKVANVKHELALLLGTWQESPNSRIDIAVEWAALKEINGKLWVVEDDIRDKERAQQFDARFIELARAVYVINDERAAVKRKINDKLGSKIVEEKSYADYKAKA